MPSLRVDLVSGVSAFGLYLIDNDIHTGGLQAFHVTGILLETLLVRGLNGGMTYAGIDVSGTGRGATVLHPRRRRWRSVIDNSFLDDLSFRAVDAQPTPVPLPALTTSQSIPGR